MNDEEILEKIQKFLEEKEGLDLQSAYFLTKKLNMDYWDRIQDESDLEVEDDEDDDLDLETTEEETPEEEAPKDHKKGIKSAIKKPKIAVKKKEKVEPPEEEAGL